VEFAVFSPLLAVMAVGAVDYSRVFYEEVALERAALAGAQWGARSVSASNDVDGMKAAVIRDLGEEVLTTVERYCTCSDESAVDCSSGSCPGDESVSVHVMVRVARDFTMLVDYPGFPAQMTIAREAHVRAR
jgi:Flp pilus assembly protein TadG